MTESKPTLFSPARVLGALGVALAVLHWKVLLGGETFFYRDFGVMGIPGAWHHRTSILEGSFPLWNPYSNCGAPFLAQWGTMVLYPLSLLYVLLPFPWSLNVFCLLHLWIGAAGAYYLARRWTGSGEAAAMGASAFLFNGVTLASLTWPNYTVAVGLAPWVLLTLDRAWDAAAQRGRAVAACSFISAAQLLAGVPEVSAFTWVLGASLWAGRLMQRSGRAWVMGAPVAILAGAAGLAAAQLLPFWELLQHSQRAPGFAAERWALPPWGWANLVLPQFYAFKTPEGTTFQYGQAFLSSTYLGIPILVLSFAGLLFSRDPRRWILAGLAVLAAILALGSAGRLLPVFQSVFPPLGVARFPVKFVYLLMFAAALLVPLGWQALQRLDTAKQKRFLAGAAAAFSVLLWGLFAFNSANPFPFDRLGELKNYTALRWIFAAIFLGAAFRALRERAWILAAMAVLVADCATHLKRQNPTIASGLFAPLDWAAAHKLPKPVLGGGRIFITPEAEASLVKSGNPEPDKDIAGKRLAQWSHLNLIDRVPKVNGSSTLQMGGQAQVQNAIYRGTNIVRSEWLDFLGAALETSSNSVVEWRLRPTARPLVSAGFRAEANPSVSINSATNLHEIVWIEHERQEMLADQTAATVSDVKVSIHTVQFAVDAERPTYAVIAQSWHPAWKAEVNGTPAPVLKANAAFQAVRVPEGKSTVRITYTDRKFGTGALLSLGTLALLALAWIPKRRRR